MISGAARKIRNVLGDPVLRCWLIRRIAGLEKPHAPYTAGAPPYLQVKTSAAFDLLYANANWIGEVTGREFQKPRQATTIHLPGTSVKVLPDEPGALFNRKYPDLETMLGAHRFAWVPVSGPDVDADWVATIWESWIDRYGDKPTGWPWHPYTAAERAINIIDFANRYGLPGYPENTLKSLIQHGQKIRDNLEYFGEHYTSNHLSNNGRGLLKIGVALGIDEFINDGGNILLAEAKRIFGHSGILKEGSSHYHLLATRNYIDAWLTAKRGRLEVAPLLHKIAENALAAVPGLCLPGGMPLIGDISPDAPPDYFSDLTHSLNSKKSWLNVLLEDDKNAANALIDRVEPLSLEQLSNDGWHRFEAENWHTLTYVPPDGWPPMPGHGHRDLGSFELHDGVTPVLVDPGRGTYTNTEYVAAHVHNSVMIDNHALSPINRPYYNDAFRNRIVSASPSIERSPSGQILRSDGFSRLSGIGKFEREWRFERKRLTIFDRIEGRGSRKISRHYFTTADVELSDTNAILKAGGQRWRISTGHPPKVAAASRWAAYGIATPGCKITFESTENLSFEGSTVLERI